MQLHWEQGLKADIFKIFYLSAFNPVRIREKLLVKGKGRNYIAFMVRVYKKYSRLPHLLAGVLLCAGFGILLYLGLMGSSMPVYSVSELLKAKQNSESLNYPEDNKTIQVYGNIAKLLKHNNLSILLQDQEIKTDNITINYTGIIPNNLKLGQAIFLTGKYDFASKELFAYEIVTSCPTKYLAKSRANDRPSDSANDRPSDRADDSANVHNETSGEHQPKEDAQPKEDVQDNAVNFFINPSINHAKNQVKPHTKAQ